MNVVQLSLFAALVAVPACICFFLGRQSSQRRVLQDVSVVGQSSPALQHAGAHGPSGLEAMRSPLTDQLLLQLQLARSDEKALARLAEQLESLVAGREQLQSRLDSLERRFNQQASEPGAKECPRAGDLLAALPDGRAFESAVSSALRQANGGDPQLSLLLIDVDHFQRFSTAHGRDAGDEALRSIAQVLLESIDADSRVARYGDSEFAVILPKTGLAEAAETAERVRSEIAQAPIQLGEEQMPFTISGGVAAATHGESLAQLISRADQARTAATKAGGDQTVLHDGAGMHSLKSASRRRRAEQAQDESPDATARSKSSQAGQPGIIDLRTDSLTGLRNQAAFLEDLRRRVAEWRRFKLPISVMCVEVDDLDDKTQELGADVGDLLTRAVTQFLATALRETDLLARLPNARFGVILPGTDPTNAVRAAERIRGAVSLCRLSVAGRELGFSISMGLANVEEGETAEEVLERAQQATDVALANAGNSTYIHDTAEGRYRPGRELLAHAPALVRC